MNRFFEWIFTRWYFWVFVILNFFIGFVDIWRAYHYQQFEVLTGAILGTLLMALIETSLVGLILKLFRKIKKKIKIVE